MEDFYGMLIGLILILGLTVVGQLVKSLEHKEETIEQLRTEVCTKEAEIEQLKKENRMLRTDLLLAREGFPAKL
jgi:cell division protein FtsB